MVTCHDTIHTLPNYEIYVDKSLNFKIRVFGWNLPNEHLIYKLHEQSVINITLSQLINLFSKYPLCLGISNVEPSTNSLTHIIPKMYSPFNTIPLHPEPTHETVYNRSPSCELLIKSDDACNTCNELQKNLQGKSRKALKRKSEILATPAKLNAPISLTSPERIKLTLQNQRAEIKSLKYISSNNKIAGYNAKHVLYRN